jgi:hypothetical protein
MGKYNASAARFLHKGSNTGNIYARCNVTNPVDGGGNPHWSVLELVYKDPGSTTQVTGILYRVSNTTGGISPIATFDSNLFAQLTTQQVNSVLFGHNFNFFAYAYYVELKVNRTATTYLPDVAIVRLTYLLE